MIAGRTFLTSLLRCALPAASLLVGAGVGLSAQAQALLRDPTIAPAGVAGATLSAASGAAESDGKVLSVLVVDGRPFVMSGSRLYAQGDKLGRATVERISETQIWLREGKELRKINLYSGVQRKPHVPGKSEAHCDPGKAALPDGSIVASSDDRTKKAAGLRAGSPAQIPDPACKSATP